VGVAILLWARRQCKSEINAQIGKTANREIGVPGIRLQIHCAESGSGFTMREIYGACMALQSPEALAEIRDTLLETYAANDAMNQLILELLDPLAWRMQLPGTKAGGRTIAAIFAHVHNARLKWLKGSAPHLKCPPPLNPYRCTMKQAAAAHRKSAAQCLLMLKDALSAAPHRRVTKFYRDSWMPTWRAGGTMFTYMFAHEAHHRGQILMLAHQLGYRVLDRSPHIWQWEKFWKEAGLKTRPR
jgi:uncharacterized damage-inducible protein DinB